MLFDGVASNESVDEDMRAHPPQIVGEFDLVGHRHFAFAACPIPGPPSDMSPLLSEGQAYCLIDLGHSSF